MYYFLVMAEDEPMLHHSKPMKLADVVLATLAIALMKSAGGQSGGCELSELPGD